MSAQGHRLIIFEDGHLLVVNKPAGVSTHSPSPYAGEGVYEWLRHREPRWAQLATIHRLDKEASGVLVFARTPLANRSLTEQFTHRAVGKKYLLLIDRPVRAGECTVKSSLVRAGERYVSRPPHAGSDIAETTFRIPVTGDARRLTFVSDVGCRMSDVKSEPPHVGCLIEAEPLTGRTHQIRVHAAEQGFPILGDTLYGGTPYRRVCLHAAELTLTHPVTGKRMTFAAAVDFAADPRLELRPAFIDSRETNAYRLVHGAADRCPGWYVDRLGAFLLSQSEAPLTAERHKRLSEWLVKFSLRGAYHKILSRHVRQSAAHETSPQHILGEHAPERLGILENGLQFELSLNEGHSVGLFLDQRENRRRFLANHVAAGFLLFPSEPQTAEVLNAFAYTCGFSVCAAKAGARATSIDLSKKYLAWGKRNFSLTGLHPDTHEFLHGDVFDWFRRLIKKARRFDVIVLDPPTFSQSKERGTFQAKKHYGELVLAALPLLKPGGVLFASTNAAKFEAEDFLAAVRTAIRSGARKIVQEHYAPQPPDFPISRDGPAYLNTVWLKVS